MSKKISIKNVQMEWLNSRCLVLISTYAKVVYEHDGTVLKLKSNEALRQLAEHVGETDNAELKLIYANLKKEIKRCLREPELAKQVAAASIPMFMISAAKDLGIAQSEIVDRWFKVG